VQAGELASAGAGGGAGGGAGEHSGVEAVAGDGLIGDPDDSGGLGPDLRGGAGAALALPPRRVRTGLVGCACLRPRRGASG
jgi:hypothetical protein